MNDQSLADIPLVKSVLHPTDFTQASNRAFAHALAIALLRQSDLTILHASPQKPSSIEWTRFPPVRETLERWGLLQAGSPRSAVFDEFRVRVKKVAVQSNSPYSATTHYLDHKAADLIVLATDDGEKFAPSIPQSDSEAIARWSHTMTLFVPAIVKRSLVSLEDGDLNLKNILVPVDRTPDCSAALEFARRTADILGDGEVVITLLHVGESKLATPRLVDGTRWSWRMEQCGGDPVEEILATADTLESDLIVMATSGRNSVLDALRGTTTEKVLRRSPCPLLAVPAS